MENIARVDGNGNILIQDINGSTLSINYNDIDRINQTLDLFNKKLVEELNSSIKSEIKQVIDLLEKTVNLTKIKDEISNPFANSTLKINPLKTIENYLNDSYKRLSEWKQEYVLAENPSKGKRSEIEIQN